MKLSFVQIMNIDKYRKSAERRFWRNVDKGDGCWMYKGYIKEGRYGIIYVGGKKNRKNMYAHRLSFFFKNNILPDELLVCHKCDNPKCVNPDHLFLGTVQDNHNDMVNKKRHTYGAKNPMAVLCDEKIKEIALLWNEGSSMKEISEKLNIKVSVISGIINRKSWRHVDIKLIRSSEGRYKFPKGDANLSLKIKHDDRAEIMKKHMAGISLSELCHQYCISKTTFNRYWAVYKLENKINIEKK